MAKRKRKHKNDASNWLASVQRNPTTFEPWKQFSRHLPVQPKRKRALGAYADRNLGIIMLLAGILILIILGAGVFLVAVGEAKAELSGICFLLPFFILIAIGLIKVGIDHIKYATE